MSWINKPGWRPVTESGPDVEYNPQLPKERERPLPNVIQGMRVTDIEARFYKAATENRDVDQIQMQVSFIAGRNMPGEIRLDFVLHSGGRIFPVWVDGEYWHKIPEQRAKDQYQDGRINARLEGTEAAPVQRVPGDDLDTDNEATKAVKDVLDLVYFERTQ